MLNTVMMLRSGNTSQNKLFELPFSMKNQKQKYQPPFDSFVIIVNKRIQVDYYKRLIQIMLASIQQNIRTQIHQGKIIKVTQCSQIHEQLGMNELVHMFKDIYRADRQRECQLLCLVTVKIDDCIAIHYQICDNILKGVLKSGRFEHSPLYFKPNHLKQFIILAIYPKQMPIKKVIDSFPYSPVNKTHKYENKFVKAPSVWIKSNIPHPLSYKQQEKNQPLTRKTSKSQKSSINFPVPAKSKKQNQASQHSQNNIKSMIQWAHNDSTDEISQSSEIFELMNAKLKQKQVLMVIEPIPQANKFNNQTSDDEGSIFAKIQMAQKATSKQKLDKKLLNNNTQKQIKVVKAKPMQKDFSLKNWISQK